MFNFVLIRLKSSYYIANTNQTSVTSNKYIEKLCRIFTSIYVQLIFQK